MTAYWVFKKLKKDKKGKAVVDMTTGDQGKALKRIEELNKDPQVIDAWVEYE